MRPVSTGLKESQLSFFDEFAQLCLVKMKYFSPVFFSILMSIEVLANIEQ